MPEKMLLPEDLAERLATCLSRVKGGETSAPMRVSQTIVTWVLSRLPDEAPTRPIWLEAQRRMGSNRSVIVSALAVIGAARDGKWLTEEVK